MRFFKCCQCGKGFDRTETGTHDFCSEKCSDEFQEDFDTEGLSVEGELSQEN
jgi:endogenous inhibitor of DNA gyrase (YacG/DUF329 family)